ncbi:MAG TPA: hypothetical protein VK838_05690, partial [Candidatus Limnocylindrales bacterium]|nr:hypothetical protein [Candidatus Limnocylindrales bacterium]
GRSVGVVIETTDDHGAEESGMGVPISGSAEEMAATLGRFGDMGFTRVELMLWENSLAGLEGAADVVRLLDAG